MSCSNSSNVSRNLLNWSGVSNGDLYKEITWLVFFLKKLVLQLIHVRNKEMANIYL